jgi:hypothetical protein
VTTASASAGQRGQGRRALAIVLGILGILALILGILYLAGSLNTVHFLVGSVHKGHHVDRGGASLAVGIVLLIAAFLTGRSR